MTPFQFIGWALLIALMIFIVGISFSLVYFIYTVMKELANTYSYEIKKLVSDNNRR